MANYIDKYGWKFEASLHPLAIELRCIQKGGEWSAKNSKGETKHGGKGLLFHFKESIRLLWPEFKQHRWFDVVLENWIKHEWIGIAGPKDASKSASMAVIHLVDYYAFPSSTTIIVSSTTLEALDNRILGEFNMRHRAARRRYEWLPGHVIEGRRRIVTDEKNDSSDARDVRNGCFVAGSLVDTPTGQIPIEILKIGDVVFNASGTGKVMATSIRRFNTLIRVTLADGRFLECTPEHPIFTLRGWVKAVDLSMLDTVLSGHETMSILRGRIRPRRLSKKILFSTLPDFSTAKKMRTMRKPFPPLESPNSLDRKIKRKILREIVREPMAQSAHRNLIRDKSPMRTLQTADECSPFRKAVLLQSVPAIVNPNAMPLLREGIYFNQGITCEKTRYFLWQILRSEGTPSLQKIRDSNTRRINSFQNVSREHLELSSQNRTEGQKWESALVQNRHCVSNAKISGGNRRRSTQYSSESIEGHFENSAAPHSRVVRVEVLQSGSDSRFDASKGGYSVHNIEVEGHPSYSVNGVIVHNCVGIPIKAGDIKKGMELIVGIKNKRKRWIMDEMQTLPASALDGAANFMQTGADCKLTGLGNPSDIMDAHGKLCEPHHTLGGWDSNIDQSGKTKAWKTRFDNGVAIQLPGSDSPNMDVGPNDPVPYPFLMTRERMEKDARTWTRNDWHFQMFNEGRWPRGQAASRVITRQMCISGGAMKDPVWAGPQRKKIGFMDAGYGGDRCVIGELDFGYELFQVGPKLDVQPDGSMIVQERPEDEKRQIIALIDTRIVPIEGSEVKAAEAQIVLFSKHYCESRGISPSDFFYEPGMRTSLVQKFTELWSHHPVSIDFGGKPSESMVSSDIKMSCRDYYFNFVTELWYSVRLIIECQQFRGMTEEVMNEGCMREYRKGGGNRIQIETKAEYKAKTGVSCDLMDACVTGVEGAKRRGFVIKRQKAAATEEYDDRWKQEYRDKAKKFQQSGRLNYAA